MKRSGNKGITLIALVVTVIVILILAGISIMMLTGQNGILNRTGESTVQTDIASTREQIELELMARYDNEGNYTNDDVIEAIKVATGEEVEEGTAIVTTAKGNDVNISNLWKGINFAKQVTATNYGDYVDYPIDLNENGDTTDDWRIFYNNGERVFIIAADYVENTSTYLNNTATGMSTTGTYRLLWSPVPTTQTVEESIRSLFMTNWADYSTYDNGKCVSTLLNTNNWTGFVDNNYADYAIGGATLEMWVASYNSKGYTSLYTNTDTYGYYIGNTESPKTSSYSVSSDANTGYNDSLYFPHKSEIGSEHCLGYWLATPSVSNSAYVMYVHYAGSLGYGRNTGYRFSGAVRPLVSLKSTVKAEQDENDTWKLSN